MTNELDLKKVGMRVKNARIKKGYSQEQLAAMLDVTQALIGHLEQGRSGVSLSTFVGIANLLDTTPDALLFDNVQLAINEYDRDFKDITDGLTQKQRAILLENARALKEILLNENV